MFFKEKRLIEQTLANPAFSQWTWGIERLKELVFIVGSTEEKNKILSEPPLYKTVTTGWGFPMYIAVKDGIVSKYIEDSGVWEYHHYHLFHKLLFPGAKVLHLGGHIGYHDFVISSIIGDTGVNQVFEPNPESFYILQKNVTDFNLNNIILHNKGVWDSTTVKTLNFSYDNTGAATLIQGKHEKSYSIELVKIDDYLPDFYPLDLLFMDIEGAELHAIKGAQNILAHSPNCIIVMEWSLGMIRALGLDIERFLQSEKEKGKIFYQFAGELIEKSVEEMLALGDTDVVISPRPLI